MSKDLNIQIVNDSIPLDYKQNRGRTASKGIRNGTIVRLSPHVQKLINIARKIVNRIDKETIKQPPRCLSATNKVSPCCIP